jgi:hypothetical protein
MDAWYYQQQQREKDLGCVGRKPEALLLRLPRQVLVEEW